MFKSFRWKIALIFMGLSTAVYIVFVLIAGFHFYGEISESMDKELKTVASQIGHAIELSDSKPSFRDWLRVVETKPARSIMSMQLFDEKGVLLEHYGPLGIPRLITNRTEISENDQSMRVYNSTLFYKNKLVGYVQLQLPTTERLEVTIEFLMTMAVMAPLVLAGFGITGYVVSGIAARPIEGLVHTLQQFIADAGHELNTPITIVSAKAQALERKLEKAGIHEKDLTSISLAAERMGFIVKDLMLLAELDSRKEKIGLNPIDLNKLVDEVIEEYADRFKEKGINLIKGNFDDATVLADQQSLQCILANLVENALKYSDGGSLVTVDCIQNSTECKLLVKDEGIGIPQEALPFIFDRFYRVDESRSRQSGGSGLGLAIVKAMTHRIGAKIEVESFPGKGSIFYVNMPSCTDPVAV